MRRRYLALAVAAVVSAAALSAAAPAGASPDSDLVDRYTQVVYELEDSAGVRVMDVQETVVDASGRMLGTSNSRRAAPDAKRIVPLQAAPFSCLNDRDREGFERHAAWELLDNDANEHVHFQYFPYSQRNAQMREGQFTQQWLVCATGGVDAENGSRITVSGPIVAYRDEQSTYRIGHAWRQGKTPSDHTVTLGFQVGKGPVQVNGSIQQTPSESLKGSFMAPFNKNRFARNQAAGWWEHGCRPLCRRWNGSADFQGSVVEGLFEFPNTKPVDPSQFYYSASVEHFCANPVGCRG